jgi:hypothetical protein
LNALFAANIVDMPLDSVSGSAKTKARSRALIALAWSPCACNTSARMSSSLDIGNSQCM